MRGLIAACLALAGATATATATLIVPDDAPAWSVVEQPPPPAGVAFVAVEDLGQSPAAMEPKLRKGQEAASKDWPTVFFMTYKVGERLMGCSAAVVGPQVLLTAAHCVPDSGSMTLTRVGAEGQEITCSRHPGYVQDPSADFALCKLPKGLFPSGVFERISITPADDLVTGARQVLLGGFGCTSASAARAVIAMRPDAQGVMRPVYMIGLASIDQGAFSKPPQWPPKHYLPSEHATMITKPDGPNVCGGDSGGPVFLLSPGHGADLRPRVIVAVNSRVLQSGVLLGPSLLSVTGGFKASAAPTELSFAAWARQWANGLAICGVVAKGGECAIA